MPIMAGVHAVIGLGEALITAGALAFVARSRPDLLEGGSGLAGPAWIAPGLAVTAGVLLIAPFASAFPDGLERVASDLGFLGSARETSLGLLPDYTVPWLGETAVSTIAAGLVGIVIVLALYLLAGRLQRGRTGEHS
jgi:cobalt/nickel transport system permease protein